MALAESLYAKLGGTAAVTALIGSGDAMRLYPTILPTDVSGDYCVWQEMPPAPDNTLNEASTSGLRTVQLACVASTYLAARTIAAKIMAALDNATLVGGERCLSVRDFDGFSEATDQFVRIIEADFFAAPAT
jgi:hypothetical protein